MKRLEKKKLVLAKRDVRVLGLTSSQMQNAAGGSGIAGYCVQLTNLCTRPHPTTTDFFPH